MRRKFIPVIIIFSLSACSATTTTGMQFMNKSPRGIKVINVTKELDSNAYQTAEKHCAKYSKVPRISKKTKQSAEYEIEKITIVFNCIRP